MRHVNSYKSRRFRTKTTGTQRYALVTILQGKTNLIYREIAFWTYQNRDRCCILAISIIR